MARYDIPIPGVNKLQSEYAIKYAKEAMPQHESYIETLLSVLFSFRLRGDYLGKRREARNYTRYALSVHMNGVFPTSEYLNEFSELIEKQIYSKALKVVTQIKVNQGLSKKDAVSEAKLLLESAVRIAAVHKIALKPAQSADLAYSIHKRMARKMSQLIAPVLIKGRGPNGEWKAKEGNPNRNTKENIEKEIRQILMTVSPYKNAILDVTSEIMSSYANKIYNAYASAGLWEKHMWVALAPRDAPCQISGEVVRVGQAFSNGRTSPPCHYNCWCLLEPVVS